MSTKLTPDEALAVLAKIPADSPAGLAMRELMVDGQALRRAVKKLRTKLADRERRIRLARRLLSPLNGDPAEVPLWDVDRTLDLRKPLSKGGRR